VDGRQHSGDVGKLVETLPPSEPNRRIDNLVDVTASGTSNTAAPNPTVIKRSLDNVLEHRLKLEHLV
jgi:hypothetical protein